MRAHDERLVRAPAPIGPAAAMTATLAPADARPAPPRDHDRPTPKPGILDIAPYVPGKSKAEGFAHPLKLSSNENPLGCSPAARAAFMAAADSLALYPDGRATALREALAAAYGLEPQRLLFGCGSDEVFTLLGQAYLQPGDNAVQVAHGFLAYRIAVRAAQAQVRFAAQPGRRIDVDAILGQVDARTRLVFLDNPGNPTGAWLDGAQVRRLHAALPGDVILVLDGAYAEFVDDPAYEDGIALARTAHNVVVSRTFSKIHGLAALRVGWGYCPEPVADACDRIRAPFNLSLPAQAAAVAALGDAGFVARSVALVRENRPVLEAGLRALGLETFPSQANFALVRFPDAPGAAAVEAEAALAARGVLVRGLKPYGLADSLRITVGEPAQNARVLEALGGFLGR